MQLNKISVTAYLDNSKHKPKDRFLTKSEVKLDVNQNKHAKIDQPISQMVVS